MVQSDSGAIGGSVSHEFMVLVNEEAENNAGENDVFYCTKCGYSANSNHAVSVLNPAETDGKFNKAEIIDTPNTHSIEELAEFLKIPSSVICKSLIYVVDGKYVVALIRGDRTVEETK
jgi:prolyl-tRNA synthetase